MKNDVLQCTWYNKGCFLVGMVIFVRRRMMFCWPVVMCCEFAMYSGAMSNFFWSDESCNVSCQKEDQKIGLLSKM